MSAPGTPTVQEEHLASSRASDHNGAAVDTAADKEEQEGKNHRCFSILR